MARRKITLQSCPTGTQRAAPRPMGIRARPIAGVTVSTAKAMSASDDRRTSSIAASWTRVSASCPKLAGKCQNQRMS